MENRDERIKLKNKQNLDLHKNNLRIVMLILLQILDKFYDLITDLTLLEKLYIYSFLYAKKEKRGIGEQGSWF